MSSDYVSCHLFLNLIYRWRYVCIGIALGVLCGDPSVRANCDLLGEWLTLGPDDAYIVRRVRVGPSGGIVAVVVPNVVTPKKRIMYRDPDTGIWDTIYEDPASGGPFLTDFIMVATGEILFSTTSGVFKLNQYSGKIVLSGMDQVSITSLVWISSETIAAGAAGGLFLTHDLGENVEGSFVGGRLTSRFGCRRRFEWSIVL